MRPNKTVEYADTTYQVKPWRVADRDWYTHQWQEAVEKRHGESVLACRIVLRYALDANGKHLYQAENYAAPTEAELQQVYDDDALLVEWLFDEVLDYNSVEAKRAKATIKGRTITIPDEWPDERDVEIKLLPAKKK